MRLQGAGEGMSPAPFGGSLQKVGPMACFTVSGQPGDRRRRPGRDGLRRRGDEAVTSVILVSPAVPAQELSVPAPSRR